MKPHIVSLAKALANNPNVTDEVLLFRGLPIDHIKVHLPEYTADHINMAGRMAFLMRMES